MDNHKSDRDRTLNPFARCRDRHQAAALRRRIEDQAMRSKQWDDLSAEFPISDRAAEAFTRTWEK